MFLCRFRSELQYKSWIKSDCSLLFCEQWERLLMSRRSVAVAEESLSVLFTLIICVSLWITALAKLRLTQLRENLLNSRSTWAGLLYETSVRAVSVNLSFDGFGREHWHLHPSIQGLRDVRRFKLPPSGHIWLHGGESQAKYSQNTDNSWWVLCNSVINTKIWNKTNDCVTLTQQTMTTFHNICKVGYDVPQQQEHNNLRINFRKNHLFNDKSVLRLSSDNIC